MVGTTTTITITDTTAWEYKCAGCSRLHERALETVDWCTPGAIPRFFMKIRRRRLRWRDREIIQWTLIRMVFGIPSQRSKCA